MNVPTGRGQAVSAAKISASNTPQLAKARAVASGMRASDAMIEIYARVARFNSAFPRWWGILQPGWTPPAVDDLRRAIPGAQARLQQAKALLARLPPASQLKGLLEDLEAFAGQLPNLRQSRLLISVFVDRYPNGRPADPITYVESLVHLAERGGYSAVAVAKACDDLLLASKFLPSPSEFKAALDDAAYPGADLRRVEAALNASQELSQVLEEVALSGAVDLTNEWRESLELFTSRGWWSRPEWGPRPGEPGCLAPEELLRDFGIEPPTAPEIEF